MTISGSQRPSPLDAGGSSFREASFLSTLGFTVVVVSFCRRPLASGWQAHFGCSGGCSHGNVWEQDAIMKFARPNGLLQWMPGFALLSAVGHHWSGTTEYNRSA